MYLPWDAGNKGVRGVRDQQNKAGGKGAAGRRPQTGGAWGARLGAQEHPGGYAGGAAPKGRCELRVGEERGGYGEGGGEGESADVDLAGVRGQGQERRGHARRLECLCRDQQRGARKQE